MRMIIVFVTGCTNGTKESIVTDCFVAVQSQMIMSTNTWNLL